MKSNIEIVPKTSRSSSITSTTSSEAIDANPFLELTMPNHHRSVSQTSTDVCGGFLQLTPTESVPPRTIRVSTEADERQRLMLLRARNY